jgi:hypothetical protein
MPVKKKPGEKIYEDDPRYEQDKFEGAVTTWRDRLKKKPEGGVAKKPPMGNATRTKDDKYTPPPKIENAVSKWKEQKKPPLLPIAPGVGPTQDAKRLAAVQNKFTPEAAQQLRQTPVAMRPPNAEHTGSGEYDPNTSRISVNAPPGGEMQSAPQTIAHEFGHKWWFENLTPQERDGYMGDHNRWEQEPTRGADVGRLAQSEFQSQLDAGLYQPGDRPTEVHARTMQRANRLPDQNAMPGYMQPYYRGLLNNVPNPRPIPNPNAAQRMGADENGLQGMYEAPQWNNRW